MSKRAIILSGVSGTRKSPARLNDPELKNPSCLDIIDIYGKFPDRSTPIPVRSKVRAMIASTSGRVQAIGGGAGMSLVKIDNIILRNAKYAVQRTISRSTTFADPLTWSAKGDLIDPGGYR